MLNLVKMFSEYINRDIVCGNLLTNNFLVLSSFLNVWLCNSIAVVQLETPAYILPSINATFYSN